jgi:hypothetical protein
MSRPVRTTLVFGLAGGLLLFTLGGPPAGIWGWPPAFKVALWAIVAAYALFLARWSHTRLTAILFPLGLLLATALWPGSRAGFLLMGLAVLSWIRSGICFQGPPLRRLAAEIITSAGGAGLAALWEPRSALAWVLALWLFFLAQTLYFYMLPGANLSVDSAAQDGYETALKEVEKILG